MIDLMNIILLSEHWMLLFVNVIATILMLKKFTLIKTPRENLFMFVFNYYEIAMFVMFLAYGVLQTLFISEYLALDGRIPIYEMASVLNQIMLYCYFIFSYLTKEVKHGTNN